MVKVIRMQSINRVDIYSLVLFQGNNITLTSVQCEFRYPPGLIYPGVLEVHLDL